VFVDEVKKKSKQIAEAEDADVHVVDEGFLDKVTRGGAALLITSHSIAPWGSDVSWGLWGLGRWGNHLAIWT